MAGAADKPDRAPETYPPVFLDSPPLIFAAALALTIFAALGLALGDQASLIVFFPYLGLAGAVAFGGFYVLLSSFRLAFLAVVALTLVIAWPLGLLAVIGMTPTLNAVLSVFAVAAVTTIQLAEFFEGAVSAIADGASAPAASARALAATRRLGPALAMPLAGLAAFLIPWLDGALVTLAAGLAAAGFSLLLIHQMLPPLLARLAFDERFAAHVHRAREWRQFLLAPLEGLAVPRWAYAGCGIAALLFVILFFEGRNDAAPHMPGLWRRAGPSLGVAMLAWGSIGSASLRDWRAFPLVVVPALLGATIGVWIATRIALTMSSSVLVVSGSIGAAFAYHMLAHITRHRQAGETMTVSFAHTIGGNGASLVFLGAILAVSALIFRVGFPVASSVGLVVVCDIAAVLFVLPQCTAVVEDLFPHRQAREEAGKTA